MSAQTPYDSLTPDALLSAIESIGMLPTGGFLALNSYENRVYQIELEDGEFVIAKFYRPARWSPAAIREEHTFCQELKDADISVVAPMAFDGETLFHHGDFDFAVFPRQGGHAPNLENQDDLEVLARTIARMHALGATRNFEHRAALTSQRLGHDSREDVIASGFVPPEQEEAYASTTAYLLEAIDPILVGLPSIRIHGDCHMGNVLWRGDTPHFVDFDDCVSGPPIQDLWMLLSGERVDQTAQLCTILDAYNDFYDFDTRTLAAIEALRSLRIMHQAAWIARRWNDPAFPQAFPWFATARYWSEHLLALREQQAALNEPPLTYL